MCELQLLMEVFLVIGCEDALGEGAGCGAAPEGDVGVGAFDHDDEGDFWVIGGSEAEEPGDLEFLACLVDAICKERYTPKLMLNENTQKVTPNLSRIEVLLSMDGSLRATDHNGFKGLKGLKTSFLNPLYNKLSYFDCKLFEIFYSDKTYSDPNKVGYPLWYSTHLSTITSDKEVAFASESSWGILKDLVGNKLILSNIRQQNPGIPCICFLNQKLKSLTINIKDFYSAHFLGNGTFPKNIETLEISLFGHQDYTVSEVKYHLIKLPVNVKNLKIAAPEKTTCPIDVSCLPDTVKEISAQGRTYLFSSLPLKSHRPALKTLDENGKDIEVPVHAWPWDKSKSLSKDFKEFSQYYCINQTNPTPYSVTLSINSNQLMDLEENTVLQDSLAKISFKSLTLNVQLTSKDANKTLKSLRNIVNKNFIKFTDAFSINLESYDSEYFQINFSDIEQVLQSLEEMTIQNISYKPLILFNGKYIRTSFKNEKGEMISALLSMISNNSAKFKILNSSDDFASQVVPSTVEDLTLEICNLHCIDDYIKSYFKQLPSSVKTIRFKFDSPLYPELSFEQYLQSIPETVKNIHLDSFHYRQSRNSIEINLSEFPDTFKDKHLYIDTEYFDPQDGNFYPEKGPFVHQVDLNPISQSPYKN